MADPRINPPSRRNDASSPLMQAKRRASADGGTDTVNFCPFGCDDGALDDHGYCPHLVGFSADGRTLEPRVRRSDGRIVVMGSKREPVKRGDRLVKITTTARVYRATPNPKLVTPRTTDREQSLFDEREEELMEQVRLLNNPVLDGEIEHTAYDDEPKKPAGKTPEKVPETPKA